VSSFRKYQEVSLSVRPLSSHPIHEGFFFIDGSIPLGVAIHRESLSGSLIRGIRYSNCRLLVILPRYFFSTWLPASWNHYSRLVS
jgi:hypothetical protein